MLYEILNLFNKFKFNRTKKRFFSLGKGNDISFLSKFYFPERVSIGSFIYIGPNAEVNGLGGVDIKNGTIIGPNITIHSANHHYKNSKYLPYDESFDFKKVTIGENVWIGGNVIIVPGSNIGEGCIVGAGTVISGNIPPLSIVVGNPCKVIKKRNEDHYYKLKKEGKLYIRNKIIKGLNPLFNEGYKS